MKIKISEKNKYYLAAFLLGMCIFMIIFLPYAARNDMVFCLIGDFNEQQIPFTLYLHGLIHDFKLPQFDFYAGTGLDFIEAYGFYNLFSPFMFLLALFPHEWTIYLFPFVIALKFGFCSLFAYIYATRFCSNKDYALIAALLYSFSAYQMVNFIFHYLDALVFFPLLLNSLEAAVTEKKRGCFGITAAICAFTNYYIFGAEVVFLILYFICRLTDKSFRISLKDFLCLATESILAILAAGIVLFSALHALMNNPRFDTGFDSIFDMFVYETPWRYARIIQALLFPPDIQGYTNFFPDSAGEYPNGSIWSSQGLYIPMFGISGVLAFAITEKKNWMTKLTTLCIIIAFIPVLNSLFSFGSSLYYARWMFAPTLIMAVMTACALEKESKYFKPGLIINGIVIAAIIIFSVLFPMEKLSLWKPAPFNNVQKIIQIIIGASGLLITFALLFKLAKDKMYSKTILVITTAFIFAFSEAMMLFYMSGNNDLSEKITIYTDYPQIENTEYGSRISSERFENCNLYSKNYSLYTFNSTINPYLNEYCTVINQNRDQIKLTYTTVCMCSVKNLIYFFQQSEDSKAPIEGDYTFVRNHPHYTIYENQNFIPIGFCYEYFITRETLMQLDENIRGEIMLRTMVLDDPVSAEGYLEEADANMLYDMSDEEFSATCSKRAEKSAHSFSTSDDTATAEITLDKPELVFFSIAYDDDFTAYVDGERTDIIKANIGFMAVPVPEGTHKIELVYHSDERTIGFVMSIIGITGLAFYAAVMKMLVTKNQNKSHSE